MREKVLDAFTLLHSPKNTRPAAGKKKRKRDKRKTAEIEREEKERRRYEPSTFGRKSTGDVIYPNNDFSYRGDCKCVLGALGTSS